MNDQVAESSGMPSVADVNRLLQITEVELHSNDQSERVLALCGSACSHSWISSKLADKRNAKGTPTKLTVHGINCHQVVNTQVVELKLKPVHSGGSGSSFAIKPYVRDDLRVGTDVIDVESLKTMYNHSEPIPLKQYSNSDVDMILGEDVFHFIRPLEYFDSDRKSIPVAVRLSLGWVLSGPLPSMSGFFSTPFKAVTNKDTDSELAAQLRSWYDIESFGAFKQVNSRSAADARAEKILEATTYHGQQWEDELPPDLVTKFLEWSKKLPYLSDITIPRAYFVGEIEALELHLFGDSSQEVFSAVAFLRAKVTTKDSGSTTELAFVFWKTRVAPRKALTIPKLELQASLLASRLKKKFNEHCL